MITSENIRNFLTEKLKETDIFIVEIAVKPGNRIFVFLDSMNNINIDDCARVNRLINQHFDRDVEDYALEVSSAGLTSPFKVEQQYIKHLGKKVKIKTIEGKIIKGVLTAYKDNTLFVSETIKINGKFQNNEYKLSLTEVLEMKLDISFLNI